MPYITHKIPLLCTCSRYSVNNIVEKAQNKTDRKMRVQISHDEVSMKWQKCIPRKMSHRGFFESLITCKNSLVFSELCTNLKIGNAAEIRIYVNYKTIHITHASYKHNYVHSHVAIRIEVNHPVHYEVRTVFFIESAVRRGLLFTLLHAYSVCNPP